MAIRWSSSLASVCGRETLTLLANTSVAVKIIAGVLIFFYALACYSEDVIEKLSVTPEKFWPPHFWIWTAFTHCFLEVHFWLVIIDIAVIVLVGKLLEPLWGAIEMMVFFMVVCFQIQYIFQFNELICFITGQYWCCCVVFILLLRSLHGHL